MLIPDSINLENACNALESMARQQALPSPELGAIELAAHALLFITAPRPIEEVGHLQMENLPSRRTVMTEWSSQGHLLEAYLAPWKEDLARRGTEEQKAFIAHIEQPETQDFANTGDQHDIETRPFADILPEPDYALRTLETLAQHYPSDSLNRARVELAIHTLRYIVQHAQVDALCKYLDSVGKRHSPSGD
jgi:hypothetical protein